MGKYYSLLLSVAVLLFVFTSCSNKEDDYIAVSPVTVDLSQVPYPKLSDYKFFEGEIKNQIPALNVLPFEPASTLFTDYAKKKRFVWMPPGTRATYTSDSK